MTLVHSAKCSADLTRDARMLIQQEIHLAKTELSQNASRLVPSLTIIVAGGLIAFGGLLAIVAAVVLGLIAIGLVAWVAARLEASSSPASATRSSAPALPRSGPRI